MRDENEIKPNPAPALLAVLSILIIQVVFERFARRYRVLRVFQRVMRLGALMSMLASVSAGLGVRVFRLGNLLYVAGRWIPLGQIVGVYGLTWPHPMRPTGETGVSLRNGRWIPLDIDPSVLREKLNDYGVDTSTSSGETVEH
jgi:hypothetical protein